MTSYNYPCTTMMSKINCTLATYEEQQQIIQKKRRPELIGRPLKAPIALPPRDFTLKRLRAPTTTSSRTASTTSAAAPKKRRIEHAAHRIAVEATVASKLQFPCAMKSLSQDELIFVEAAQKLQKCPSPSPTTSSTTSSSTSSTPVTPATTATPATPATPAALLAKRVTPHGSANTSPVPSMSKKMVWTSARALPAVLHL